MAHRRGHARLAGLVGGPDRDRTDDLFHAMEARSQLRHRPTLEDFVILARGEALSQTRAVWMKEQKEFARCLYRQSGRALCRRRRSSPPIPEEALIWLAVQEHDRLNQRVSGQW